MARGKPGTGSQFAGGERSTWRIEIAGLNRLNKFLAAMDESAPEMTEVFDAAREPLRRAVEARNPTSGAVTVGKVTGTTGTSARRGFLLRVKHPAAASFEFGRNLYWRGYTGRQLSSGKRFYSTPGFRARTFVGIKDHGHAIGAAAPQMEAEVQKAIEAVWERLAVGGSDAE